MERESMPRQKVVEPDKAIANGYSIIGVTYCLAFIVFYSWIQYRPELIFFHLFILAGVTVNHFVLLKTQNYYRAGNVIMGLGLFAIFCVFATGGLESSGILWPLVYLPAVFFLNKGQNSLFWVCALFGGCALYTVLHFAGKVTLPYTPMMLVNFFLAFLLETFLILLYHRAAVTYESYLPYTRKLFEINLDPFVIADKDGVIQDVNNVIESVTGLSREQLIGKNLGLYFSEPGKFAGICASVSAIGSIRNYPLVFINQRTRKSTEVLVNATIYKEETTNVLKIYFVMRDITDRVQVENSLRESEQQISTIFNNAPNAVVVIDQGGTIIRWNPEAEAIFGWKADEVLGRAMHHVIMPLRYREMHLKGLRNFIETGKGHVLNKSIELAGLRKGNIEFPIEIRISATKQNEKYMFIAFISDISERKRVQEEQNRMMVLEHKNRELENFTYILSHDLKTPLRGISNLSEWIGKDAAGKLDKEGVEHLEMMQARVKRLQLLIDGVLKYIAASRTDNPKAHINCNVMVSNVLHAMVLNDDVRVELDHELPEVIAVKEGMEQVFSNLIENAIRHSDKAITQINIGCASKNGSWEFYVKDNGPGIDQIYHDKIFQIFQTLDTKDESDGTGIGLAVVKKVVENEGGKVWVESEQGTGSIFYFTLNKRVNFGENSTRTNEFNA